MPAYIHTTKYKTYELYKIVSGFTGKYDGEIIYSPLKTAAFGGAVGLTIGGLTLLFKSNPYIAIGSVLFRMGLFSGAGGLFSGLWAKYFHDNKYNRARLEQKREKEYNNKTKGDSGDSENDHENMGSHTKTNNYSDNTYPEDECRLLGLNHRKKITLSDLKNARIEKLKQWHPDVTPGNKKIATDMSIRINGAYEKLFDIVKYQN